MILVEELRSYMPRSQKKQKQNKTKKKQNLNNRNNIITNSIKILKLVHVKKYLKKILY